MKRLTAHLDVEQVTAWWPEHDAWFTESGVDVSAVTKIDSAGVAFLVKWTKACLLTQQKPLEIFGVSPQLRQLIELYGVSELFTLNS